MVAQIPPILKPRGNGQRTKKEPSPEGDGPQLVKTPFGYAPGGQKGPETSNSHSSAYIDTAGCELRSKLKCDILGKIPRFLPNFRFTECGEMVKTPVLIPRFNGPGLSGRLGAVSRRRRPPESKLFTRWHRCGTGTSLPRPCPPGRRRRNGTAAPPPGWPAGSAPEWTDLRPPRLPASPRRRN